MLRFIALTLSVSLVASQPAEASFVFNDFASTAGLQLNGSATTIGNILRLTAAQGGLRGSVFTSPGVSLGAERSFNTFFEFQMSNGTFNDGSGSGADGLAFVIHSSSVSALGGGGSELGYSGIANSVAIEFDTFPGWPSDPNGNHVGVDVDGSLVSVATVIEPVPFNSGSVWSVWIDYEGVSNQLEVRWTQTGVRPIVAQLSHMIDIASALGPNPVFVGFTAATGGVAEAHDIIRWEFTDSTASPAPVVPEPTSLALAGCAGLGLVVRSLRRRRNVSQAG